MFHHDDRDYDVAASAAASKGRVKMEEIIHEGLAGAERVVAEIQSKVLTDRVARAHAVRLRHDDEGRARLLLLNSDAPLMPLHNHGLGQLLGAAGVRKDYADYLAKEAGGEMWGKELLEHNVNEILRHRDRDRHLVRAEGAEQVVKGFLSDRFRRLDSRPLVDAFIGGCDDYGLVPLEGTATETLVKVRAVLPKVFEPVANEVMIFGAELVNSDYGRSGLEINVWCMRVWCTNLAVTSSCLRQVHLSGKPLPDDIRFSDETYALDSKLMSAKVRDVVGNTIAPHRVNAMLEAVREADSMEVRGRDGVEKALKRGAGSKLTKEETNSIAAIFEGEDVVNVPAGQTVYRLSNAVSWFAKHKGVDPDRRLELQDLAGELLMHGGKTPGVVLEV